MGSFIKLGQAKERQKKTAKILLIEPNCCFCGEKASTIDHCPPRCFFLRRDWPEGYAFSCCEKCNAATRYDEQIVAVLSRIYIGEDRSLAEEAEWQNLLRGVKNNQPEMLEEWSAISATGVKRFFRESFGVRGDALRHRGWGAINIGPLTKSALNRVVAKLAKALYYKHVGYRCDGTITWGLVDTITDNAKEEYFKSIIEMVPSFAEVQRNRIDLSDQFGYRYNASSELGGLVALVRFSEQLMIHLIVLGRTAADKINIRPDGKFTVSAV